MIRVLIVDDDKLVRQGLITSMPWERFGMTVVGEAKNGEKALEFLESHPVDLLLADLAMPVMSGMELMRIVRKRFPHLFVVVLTLHQDFEYIQEALRLGAIDYIAKVELEKDHFDQVLGRIRDRMQEDEAKSGSRRRSVDRVQPLAHDFAWSIMTPSSADNDVSSMLEQKLNDHPVRPPDWQTGPIGVWLPTEAEQDRQLQADLLEMAGELPHVCLLHLTGLNGQTQEQVMEWLSAYRERRLFYDLQTGKSLYELTCREETWLQTVSENELQACKQRWSTLSWVHRPDVFEQMLDEWQRFSLAPARLKTMLSSLRDIWGFMYHAASGQELEQVPELFSWEQTEGWLRRIRQQMSYAIGKPRFSEEVQQCIARSLNMIHEELAESVHAADVAARVGMSRSYFSQCFREWTGMTFNQYVRQIRMEKAKEYLQYTDRTVAWVAENTGYLDEKYFSRTFRRITGVLPSEYRQLHRQRGDMSADPGDR